MAGMDGLLCTEEALEDEDFGMLDSLLPGSVKSGSRPALTCRLATATASGIWHDKVRSGRGYYSAKICGDSYLIKSRYRA